MNPSKAERYRFYNSLVSLVKALTGRYTLIDLRNDSCVSGKIAHVDGYMNVEMEDVVFYNPRGSEYTFDAFFISARNIRYVHIPDHLSVKELLETELAGLLTRPTCADRRNTFKVVRAERYQKETLESMKK